jgi:NTE family protein
MPETTPTTIASGLAPVSESESKSRTTPRPGMALALSGGGYRAMLFHTGVLWRLYDSGILPKLQRISSVSGGSIVSALLGLKWQRITGAAAAKDAFEREIVNPIREIAHVNIDAAAIGKGTFLPGTISEYVAKSYASHLYGEATLQDLPDDPPRFVINATNVQSGALWRFSKPYMRDYLVGKVSKPTVRLADAVAASSAFPPFLSPARIPKSKLTFDEAVDGEPLHRPPFTTDVVLSDGGVYDNLGLETIWKSYDTLLVSDAGQKIASEEEPDSDWPRHAKRILDIVDNQVRSLRKRQLIGAYEAGLRKGAYWGIRTNVDDYGVPGLACPFERTQALAAVPTRLADTDDLTQERLVNWGYAICDTAVARFVAPQLERATRFPYPGAAV